MLFRQLSVLVKVLWHIEYFIIVEGMRIDIGPMAQECNWTEDVDLSFSGGLGELVLYMFLTVEVSCYSAHRLPLLKRQNTDNASVLSVAAASIDIQWMRGAIEKTSSK